jgi:putative adenylate-forming enzyme
VKLTASFQLLGAYGRARWLDSIRDRTVLEKYQRLWLRRLTNHVTRHSPYYARLGREPFTNWPVIDKATWMAGFDDLNTVDARLEEVSAVALRAERTRDFAPTWQEFTVGLSTGTSGSRGLFLVSSEERARWAGTLLGKLLRAGLLARERIALVLRAGSGLYETIAALRLSFRFFDQAQPWEDTVGALAAFRPTILVAPPRVLRLLIESGCELSPRRVISVAEVLDDLDRARIEAGFAVPVEQIYQATEGLLGISCEVGTVHLNEPYLLVESEWQDPEHTRFVPIVTDLWRRTQPVIRYRLNDILRIAPVPCPCGRATRALAAIDGRLDDVLWLDGRRSAVAVFPDLLTRAIVAAVSRLDDFEIVEKARGRWQIGLRPLPSPETQQRLLADIRAVVSRLNGTPPQLEITTLVPKRSSGKQRRVRSSGGLACAS